MDFIRKLFGSSTTGISPTEAQAKLQQKERPFLLDVRQPDEFRSGHIQGAKLIPLNELQKRLGELPKNREILCVCRSGNRSASAVRQLTAAGHNAINLSGGISAWSRAGLPLKKGG